MSLQNLLLVSGLVFSALSSTAYACKMTMMGASARDLTDAIHFVIESHSIAEQQMNSVSQVYNAYGAVVVEVVANDEAGTCRPYVLEIQRDASCRATVTEKKGEYKCRVGK